MPYTIGSFAIIFDQMGWVLLCHRRDIDLWNLPGGGMEHGELPTDAVVRETKEETGLEVVVERLVGVYGKLDKDELVFAFTCRVVGGQLSQTDEADACEYFKLEEIPTNTSPKHVERIQDALLERSEPIFRIQTLPSSKEWLERISRYNDLTMSILENIHKIRSPQINLPVLESIKKRFSPRVYSPEPIPDADLEIIFEAARWAPSGRNYQPWSFYVARSGTPEYENLFAFIPDNNLWAKTAPVIIVACYDPTDPKDITNRFALYDLGAAVISLVLQATQLNYACRQIGIFDCEKTKQEFLIPDPFLPFVLIALGKMGTEEDYQRADQELIQKELTPRPRKPKIYQDLKTS